MKRLRSFLSRRNSQRPQAEQKPLQQNAPAPVPAPTEAPRTEPVAASRHVETNQAAIGIQATPGSLNIALRNDTTSSIVYAFITGLAIDHNNALFLLQADARTPYYPASPANIQQPLQANCAIPLGAPGNTVNAQIPHIAGGRIWFSIGTPLTFKLNPGPALVEPSVTNNSDPNINLDWAFAEFTYNSDQLYANISYVDFVSLPVSLQLDTINSGTQRVFGLPTTGLQTIANGLRTQAASDHQGWDHLIINRPGTNNPLRVLSPNQGMVVHPNLLSNYYDAYVNQVYTHYASQVLNVDTQSGYGVQTSIPSSGRPAPGSSAGVSSTSTLVINTEAFSRPTTRDIFTCSTGPFATGASQLRNTLIPRLAAAFNRSTLLTSSAIPAPLATYYKNAVTNHYSRIVHATNLDGKGYAFPYDDVLPSGGADQSGEVHAGDPRSFTVAVGGARAGK